MIKLSFDDDLTFFFSRTMTINFLPISAHIQVIVSLSLCSVTWALIFDVFVNFTVVM